MSASLSATPENASVDLTNCDREPIHLIGAIQPAGFLLAMSPDWRIVRSSDNAPAFLGRPLDNLLGMSLRDVFDSEAVHTVSNRMAVVRGDDDVERAFGVMLQPNGPRFDLAVHMSGQEFVIEAEPSEPNDQLNASSLIRSMFGRLNRIGALSDLLREAARQMRALTGHDRVMIYRFHPDGSGEVVAERARADLEPFLGLRYPASDIPKQARTLFERNIVRVIPDVAAKPSRIVSTLGPSAAPIDLSMSTLRAASSMHVEYLKNMGVQASLTLSLLREGRLWGLIACHHTSPRQIGYERRTTAELFAHLLSLTIESRERDEIAAYEERTQGLHIQLMTHFAEGGATGANLEMLADRMAEIVPCDGLAIQVDKETILKGQTPSHEEVAALTRFLRQRATSEVYAAMRLGDAHPPARDYVVRAAGLLAIPVSRAPQIHLMFFRRETAQSVVWAGDPAKPVEPSGPNGVRLTPRKSFEAWSEIVVGQSKPWTKPELRAAEALRATLLEVVLRLTSAAEQARESAARRQDLLIAELNHRVRNILTLIRGLITQSKSGTTDVEAFAAVIGGRVQALARAHDQITNAGWGPGSFETLIATEASVYLNQGAHRVKIQGPPIMLQPEAFATLALVMHEMITNAAKYGALCDRTGLVTIEWATGSGGDLVVEWRESGGPPVQAPQRRGFGTTLIERAIPHDLNGEAIINYALAGVRARFVVPSKFVVTASHSLRPISPAHTPEPHRLSGAVLLVEDSMIIAMDVEEMLLSLGAERVETAANVTEALRILERERPEFALLDINLGNETSFLIADRLRDLNVPFVFGTGYGDEVELPPEHQGRAVVKKPYDAERLGIGFKNTESARSG